MLTQSYGERQFKENTIHRNKSKPGIWLSYPLVRTLPEGNGCKACLDRQGYSQKAGVDFDEVFSRFVIHSSVLSMIVIVSQLDLEHHMVDAKTAFVNADLQEEM